MKYGWLVIIWVGLFFSIATGALAQTNPMSEAEYWANLDDTRVEITRLAQTPNLTAARRLADEWEAITQVHLPNGAIINVDHSFLVVQLRADPPNYQRIANLLDELQATRLNWIRTQHFPSDTNALRQILGQNQFQWAEAEPSFLSQWWDQLMQTLWNWLSGLIPDEVTIPVENTLSGAGTRYILTTIVALVLIALVVFLLRESIIQLVRSSALDPHDEDGDELLTADTAFKRAQNLSNTGDYRSAVRYLYLSSLLVLDERGILRYDRSQTNREYLRSVAHSPHLSSILRDVIDVFDRVWYGYHTLDEATYDRYARRVTELRQQR